MPPIAHLMMANRTTDIGATEKGAVELYHVVDLTGPDSLDATEFNQAQGLPLANAPHASAELSAAGVIVRSRRLVKIWSKPIATGQTVPTKWDAFVLVTYSNRAQFSLYNMFGAGGMVDGGAIRIQVPCWRGYFPDTGPQNYFLTWGDETRRTARMRFVRNATGITETQKLQIINLSGRMYYFPVNLEAFSASAHIPFILSTPRIYKNQFNQDVIEYEFTTELPVGGIAPATGLVDVAVPALRALEDWVTSTTTNAVIVPTVTVRTARSKNQDADPQSRTVIPFMAGNL